ncbi:serine protease nudel-like isoform X4 [Penaeus indicus]|uniref:serine protease nudel-like isoform X4 n=1 Tax=Penaeus indicus TaxID=29960 RepID=UPI00300C83C1
MVPCSDSRGCYLLTGKCDGLIQCNDASDELQCSCFERMYSAGKHCDSYPDCPDFSDERGCDGCSSGELSCKENGTITCVPELAVCDGRSDCADNSDEKLCSRLSQWQVHTSPLLTLLSEGYMEVKRDGSWLPLCADLETNYAEVVMDHCDQVVGSRHAVDNQSLQPLTGTEPIMWVHYNDTSKLFSVSSQCSQNLLLYVKCSVPTCGNQSVERKRRKINTNEDSVEDLRSYRSLDRIVGGREAEANVWSFIVGILSDGIYHCGGTILTSEWILTVSHCFSDFYLQRNFEVQAGMYRRGSWSPFEQTSAVSRVIRHPEFNSLLQNDVALVKLETPLYLNRWVRPVCLARDIHPEEEDYCTVAGWGTQIEGEIQSKSDTMMEVDVPILGSCLNSFPGYSDESLICAGYKEGMKDACAGDSGGPLMCYGDTEGWVQAGIVSFGRGCARPNEPGSYSRVTFFYSWIIETLGKIEDNENLPAIDLQTKCLGSFCQLPAGKCLHAKLVCDREVNCLDAVDELYCNPEVPATPSTDSLETSPTITTADNNASDVNTQNTASDAAGANNTASDAAGANNTASDAAGANNTASDAAGANNTASDAAGANNTASDAAGANNTASDAAGANNTASDAAGANNTASDAAGANNTASDAAGANNTASDAAGANNTASDAAGANNTASDAAGANNTASDAAGANNTASDAAGANNTASDAAGANNTASDAAGANNTASDAAGANNTASDAAGANNTASDAAGANNTASDAAGANNTAATSNYTVYGGYNNQFSISNAAVPPTAPECSYTEFVCEKLPQCVPMSNICDGVKDCADGTDEVPCDSLDRLLQYNSSWHCDGYHDCFDLRDENCPPPIVCQGMHVCHLSRECVPHDKVCDSNIDCVFAEDEMECLTLLKEPGKLVLNKFMQPEHRSNGTLAYRGTTEWRPVCLEEIPDHMLSEICEYLGYREVKKWDSVIGPTELNVVMPSEPEYSTENAGKSRFLLNAETSFNMDTFTRVARRVSNEPLVQDTKRIAFMAELQALENGRKRKRVKREENATCPQVEIVCQTEPCGKIHRYFLSEHQPLHELGGVPWAGTVFVNGGLWCGSTLVHPYWVITSKACMDYDGEGLPDLALEYVSVVMGSWREVGETRLWGAHEHDRRVDFMKAVENTDILLLHLEKRMPKTLYISHLCLPSTVVDNMAVNKTCTIAGYSPNEYRTTRGVELESGSNCGNGSVCFLQKTGETPCMLVWCHSM